MAGILDGEFWGGSSGLLGNLGTGIGNNPNLLMGLGSGIMQGGFGQGLQGAMAGGALDQKQRMLGAMQQSTYASLRARGLSHEDATAAVFNPAMLKGLMPVAIPTIEPHNNGDYTVPWDKARGPSGPAIGFPKYEAAKPGEQPAVYTPPEVPGLGGGAQRPAAPPAAPLVGGPLPGRPKETVMSVEGDPSAPIVPTPVPTTSIRPGSITPLGPAVPEKPPAGYELADPKNPSKGLSPIPGGPATHMAGETAGKLAMMETATKDLPEARKLLTQAWGMDPTQRAYMHSQATLGFGPIGRAQRTVSTAVEGVLRLMSGAAVPPAELARYNDLFMPSQLDNPETAKQKLDNLERFIANAKTTVTQGRSPTAGQPAKDQARFKFNPTTGSIE